jgi:hypothetical protein
MHADVTNKTIVVCENSDAPLLGCAVLAAFGLGIHPTIHDAVQHMIHTKQCSQPNPIIAAIYDIIYKHVYVHVANTISPITHSLHQIQQEIQPLLQQFQDKQQSTNMPSSNTILIPRGGAASHQQQDEDVHDLQQQKKINKSKDLSNILNLLMQKQM